MATANTDVKTIFSKALEIESSSERAAYLLGRRLFGMRIRGLSETEQAGVDGGGADRLGGYGR